MIFDRLRRRQNGLPTSESAAPPLVDVAPPPFEVDETFDGFDSWMAWLAHNARPPELLTEIGERILRQGFVEPFTHRVVTHEALDPTDRNWREGLLANGLNSRLRAVLAVLGPWLEPLSIYETSLYAPEAWTSLALLLRGRFPRFVGSEYAATPEALARMYPIPHEDLLDLSFRSDAFDFVTTNEVLEHVPDLDRALAEIARVLKPGGWHVGTHPFRFGERNGLVQARIEDGGVVHLQPPEYHGNPNDPDGGSLVFEMPGWDILDRAKAAGFSQAFMRFIASERAGILSEPGGVFVLCAQK